MEEWKKSYSNVNIEFFACDISKEEERKKFVSFVQKQVETLEILVNNVGTNVRKPFLDYSEEEVNKIVNTNLMSFLFLSKELHGLLKKSGNGAVVNISSVAGISPIVNGSIYAYFHEQCFVSLFFFLTCSFNIFRLTKSAMNQLTKSLAVEWAKDGIRVNVSLRQLFFSSFNLL